MVGPKAGRGHGGRRERAKYGSLIEADRLTVSQLCRLIDETLKDHLPRPVRVVGEVSGLRDRAHWYFDLKDAEAVVNCVAFASVARTVKFPMRNGMEVVLTGRVEHYPKQGKTQLYVSKIEPIGAGALELAYQQLCEELRRAGYFDLRRKKPLPTFPRRIAIVTSRSGAALQDVLDTMRRRCPAVDAALVDVRVQGDKAAGEIAQAIAALSERHEALRIDAVILTRGGGSMEDLWAFNERIVADALFRCRVPVVAAIGHETDTTIAELVADERAATPTQAAMRVTPDREPLREQLSLLGARLERSLTGTIRHERQRLLGVTRHRAFAEPAARVREARLAMDHRSRRLASALRHRAHDGSLTLTQLTARLRLMQPKRAVDEAGRTVDSLAARLQRAVRSRLSLATERAGALERQLTLSGPANVLSRGYSYTLDASGRAIRSVRNVKPSDVLRTHLADGVIESVVRGLSDSPQAPGPATPPRRPAPQPSRQADESGQMDLFDPLE